MFFVHAGFPTAWHRPSHTRYRVVSGISCRSSSPKRLPSRENPTRHSSSSEVPRTSPAMRIGERSQVPAVFQCSMIAGRSSWARAPPQFESVLRPREAAVRAVRSNRLIVLALRDEFILTLQLVECCVHRDQLLHELTDLRILGCRTLILSRHLLLLLLNLIQEHRR